MAGQTRRIFTDHAVKRIFDFTGGTPREINKICDVALLIGSSRAAREIDAACREWQRAFVERVALPAPASVIGEAVSVLDL